MVSGFDRARRLSPSSLAGRTLHERLRSTSLGLFGLIAAAGLGLVAIASDQGLPPLTRTGLPPVPRERVAGARALTSPSHGAGAAVAALRPSRRGLQEAVSGRGGPAPHPGPGSAGGALAVPGEGTVAPPSHHGAGGGQGGGGHHAPGGTTPPAADQPVAPAGKPATEPAPGPVPAPSTEPPPAPVTPAESSHGNGKAKGHEKAPAGESPAPESTESGPPSPGNGKGHAFGHSK